MSNVRIQKSDSGDIMKVNPDKRAVVEAITSPLEVDSLLKGRAFTLPTGTINLTNTTEAAILYFSHEENADLVLLGKRMILWTTSAVGATDSIPTGSLKFYIGSTGISGGSSFTPISNSIGSAKQLSGTFTKGALGATVTGGTAVTEHIVPVGAPYILDFNALYLKDRSLAVTFIPPAGNTSITLSYILNVELVSINNY